MAQPSSVAADMCREGNNIVSFPALIRLMA